MNGETNPAVYAMGESEIDLVRREVRVGGSRFRSAVEPFRLSRFWPRRPASWSAKMS